jgi:hypothetical protein
VERIYYCAYLKRGDKTDYSNYRGMPLLPTTYRILFHVFVSRLTLCVDESTGCHRCGFWRNRSTNDQILMHLSDNGEKWSIWGTASVISRCFIAIALNFALEYVVRKSAWKSRKVWIDRKISAPCLFWTCYLCSVQHITIINRRSSVGGWFRGKHREN